MIRPDEPSSQLNRRRRNREIQQLADGHKVDVVVIGGGITGVGAALDAASRGLSVALVERGDLASGTSAYSSKLVHGGLRYLAKGDVAVAHESATERSILAGTVAPHLIRPLAQVIPLLAGSEVDGLAGRFGFAMGDALRVAAKTPKHLLPRARLVGAERALTLAPTVRTAGLRGAAVGWDCQLVDDARLVVSVARTAAAFGTKILTRVRVDNVAATHVSVTDTLTNESFEIRCDYVVNATGVWAAQFDPGVEIQVSRGTHVVVPTNTLGGARVSLTVPVPGHFGRFVFSLPQDTGLTYIGLTDEPVSGGVPDRAQAAEQEIDWILDTFSTVLEQPLTRADVVGTYAGLRPLVGSSDEDTTADISRKHLVQRTDNLVTVTGGKLTTYRRMAADAIDQISAAKTRTADLPLVGAEPATAAAQDVPVSLRRRFGAEASNVWQNRPRLRRSDEAQEIVTAQWEWAVTRELAVTPEDLVDRRTRLGLNSADRDSWLAAAERFLARG